MEFLDGDLTRSEADQIEEKLEVQESFRKRMADIRDLDTLLAARTAELPSMRFTTSVMERLTDQVSSAFNYFSLSKKFIRWYFAALTAMLVAVAVVGVKVATDGSMSANSEAVAERVMALYSSPAALIFFQVSIGLAALFFLDFFLRRKYNVAP